MVLNVTVTTIANGAAKCAVSILPSAAKATRIINNGFAPKQSKQSEQSKQSKSSKPFKQSKQSKQFKPSKQSKQSGKSAKQPFKWISIE